MPRMVLLVLTILAMPLLASAQVRQVADSTFVPTVPDPAFTKQHLRVLFDEAHNEFHTLEGRYRSFGDLMTADGCDLTPNHEPFSAKVLADFDVLVIANALGNVPEEGADSTMTASAFTPNEIEVVHQWVNDGGALLLIADHAPFGSAAAALGARFGVNMSMGYSADSLQAAMPGAVTNIEFTRERGTLGAHPIMEGRNEKERISKIVAFTGQSLLGPEGASPLMILSDAALDIPAEAIHSGDPALIKSKAVSAKGRSMAVALQVGHGRAVIQGEAGMLSAQLILRPGQEPYKFGMNRPGLDNQQYALNVMRWLAGASR